MRETSSSFLGVPSGFVESRRILPRKPTTSFTELGELRNREILACADVQDLRIVIFLHQKEASFRQIVDVEKLAPRCARTPEVTSASPCTFAW